MTKFKAVLSETKCTRQAHLPRRVLSIVRGYSPPPIRLWIAILLQYQLKEYMNNGVHITRPHARRNFTSNKGCRMLNSILRSQARRAANSHTFRYTPDVGQVSICIKWHFKGASTCLSRLIWLTVLVVIALSWSLSQRSRTVPYEIKQLYGPSSLDGLQFIDAAH